VKKGSLTIVGTGIQAFAHLSAEARQRIRSADRTFYLVGDPLTEGMILELKPAARSLAGLYHPRKHRLKTYRQMVDAMLAPVREGLGVCAAFYGHPGVFATAPHVAVRMARQEGHRAEMLPAVSAEACLFADLGVDPAGGWQSFEATEFLLRRRRPDPRAGLALWQVGMIGESRYGSARVKRKNLRVLAEALSAIYGERHEVVVYEASPLPGLQHTARRVRLADLPRAEVSWMSTLYVPPLPRPRFDRRMMRRLGMREEDVRVCVR